MATHEETAPGAAPIAGSRRPGSASPGATRSTLNVWGALALVVCTLPAALYLARLPRVGHLQWHDYYNVLGGMIEGDHFGAGLARWLTIKSNEHTVTVPALIYAANIVLFRGDNRPLVAFAILAQLVVVLLLLQRAPPDFRRSPAAALAAAVIGGLAFTPVGSHQFILGFSGVMWVTADLLAVLAVIALQRSGEAARPVRWIVLALAAAGTGVVTFSTSLAVWPALLLGALLLPRARRELPLLGLGALVAVHVAVALYQRPSHHPGLVLTDLGALWSFVAVFLGWIFSPARGVAAVLGWVGLLAGAGVWLAALRMGDSPTRREMLPWLLLQVYGLGNAAMAAVARLGFGAGAATQARYALLAALFWIGIFGAAGVLLWRQPPRRWRAPAGITLAALAALAVGKTWNYGAQFARQLLADAAYHPVAAIAVRYGIADDWAFRHFFNGPARTWLDGVGRGTRPFMLAWRHVPFDHLPGPVFGEVLPPEQRAGAPAADLAGGITRVTGLGGSLVRVEGWLDNHGAAITSAVAMAADGAVRGEMAVLPHVPAAAELGRPRAVVFAGYAMPRSPGEELQIVVRRRSDPRFFSVGAPWPR